MRPCQPLTLTGERTVPGVRHEAYWFARHEAAYRWALAACARDVRGGVVLEAGCGEGYGVALAAAAGARACLGLDYDATAVGHARRSYGTGPTSGFARANVVALPLRSSAVDVVLSLQVLEHIWTPHELLAEVARVLRPGGLLVLTTPNRLTFSPGLGRREKPANPFHVAELDAEELAALVGAHLQVEAVLGLHLGARLAEHERRHGSLVAAQLARQPADWDRLLADLVASVRADDFEVSAAAAASCLDLVVLARRPA